jgi:hypothetical protein
MFKRPIKTLIHAVDTIANALDRLMICDDYRMPDGLMMVTDHSG